MGEPKTCNLRAKLFRFGGADTSYDVNSGLRRSMVFWGWIDDSDDYGPRNDRFHGKGIRVTIYAPRNLEWEDKIKRNENIDSSCGVACINANVEPKQFDFDGEQKLRQSRCKFN
jgi:hypothetical protein